jgi:hypothetical protein
MWIPATAMPPSPTAAAQRLTEPERTSPAAKTPGRLVSSGAGRRLFSRHAAASATSAPVLMKPLSSLSFSGGNHSVHGRVPIIEKTAGVLTVSTHGPEDFEHGVVAGRERIMLSSQGSWRSAAISGALIIAEYSSHLVFGKRVVRITVQPMLAGLRGSDDRMTTRTRVLACVPVWRAVAAERNSAFLAGPQMHPVVADLDAFFAFAALRVFD